MKHLTIVVPNGNNNLSSITGTFEIFSKANAYWTEQGNRQLFTIQLAGMSESTDFNEGLFIVSRIIVSLQPLHLNPLSVAGSTSYFGY